MAKQSETFLSMLYDFWSPHVERDEFLFYHRILIEALKEGGKALELSCGSGRLLLPFKAEGIDVSGIEGSIELCQVLQKRAKEANLSIELSQMQLEEAEIKGRFKVIYSTLGSFQMVSDYEDAVILLAKIYAALEDNGVVSIALFLPLIGQALNDWVIASDHKDLESKQRYVRREKSFHDEVEQVVEGKIRYETWIGWDLLEMNEKDLKLRWYSKHEFIFLLKEAGFKNIELHRSYDETKEVKKSFMLFLARK